MADGFQEPSDHVEITLSRRHVEYAMVESPGTVSRILWHFTGGPTWNTARQRQNRQRKPASAAYDALVSILRSRTLRLGQYREIVQVSEREVRRWNQQKRDWDVKRNVVRDLTSSAICSLADIPVAHLTYHARRYGKFAIGFHRGAVIRHGFNPVLYTLPHTDLIRTIYEGFAGLDYVYLDDIVAAADGLNELFEGAECAWEHPIVLSSGDLLGDIRREVEKLENSVEAAIRSYELTLAFVKTFQPHEFASIYTEREWRAVRAFAFRDRDIAMVVLPRREQGKRFFERFIADELNEVRLPRTIPIVAWEDLLEY